MTPACSLRKAEPGVSPPYVGTRATEEKEIGISKRVHLLVELQVLIDRLHSFYLELQSLF